MKEREQMQKAIKTSSDKRLIMLPLMQLNIGSLGDDLWTVLALFYLVWVFSWGKKSLGSARLAILFAVIVVYLAFFLHPELVWIPLILFLIANFASPMLEKINVFKGTER